MYIQLRLSGTIFFLAKRIGAPSSIAEGSREERMKVELEYHYERVHPSYSDTIEELSYRILYDREAENLIKVRTWSGTRSTVYPQGSMSSPTSLSGIYHMLKHVQEHTKPSQGWKKVPGDDFVDEAWN
jgi:hypothetical protein